MTQKHGLLISLSVLAGLLALWLLLREPRESPVAIPQAAPVIPSTDPSEASAGDHVSADLSRTEAGDRSEVRSVPTRVAGKIRFVDQHGDVVTSQRGFIDWIVHQGPGRTENLTCAIVDDAWELECESDWVLEPVAAVWSSEATTQNSRVDTRPIPAKDAQGSVITAFLSFGFRLNVVDKLTAEHLDGVQVVLADSDTARLRELRCAPLEILDRLTPPQKSPLVLPDRPGIRAGWVIAPGHAWARFAYSGSEGEVTVALAADARVEVDVTTDESLRDTKNLWLLVHLDDSHEDRLAPDLRPPIFAAGLPTGLRLDIAGLPTGPMRFSVSPSSGVPPYGPFLGSTREVLLPGQHHRVHIGASRVTQDGTLGSVIIKLSAGSGQPENPRAILEPRDARMALGLEQRLERVERGDASYQGEFTNIVPGRYFAVVQPGALGQPVDVVPGQSATVGFELRSLHRVDVMVYQEGTNSPMRGPEVQFRPVGSTAVGAWSDARVDMDTRVYSFHCAPGTIRLRCSFGSYPTYLEDIQVPTRDKIVVVTLRKGVKIPVLAKALQGSAPAYLPMEYWGLISVEPISPTQGKCVGMRLNSTQLASLAAMDSTEAQFWLSGPGSYRFSFPEWPGLGRVAPKEIDVLADGSSVFSIPVSFE